LIKDFTDEYLHGNIDELANFSFWYIAGNPKYDGLSYGTLDSKYDGDRTNIVYAIDYLLYKERIPNLTLRGYVSNSETENFSGDTINTFNSLFGSIKYRESVANTFNFTNSELHLRDEFYRTYQKIGNFYLLPCGNNKNSINSFRGKNAWRDYFDIFLKNLKKCLSQDNTVENSDKNFQCLKDLLMKNENALYFGNKNFDSFLHDFYLEDYADINYNHPDEKNGIFYAHYVCPRSIDVEKYKKFAFGYIAKATELINKRSLKLVEVLKTKLEK
jgi:hypothetical protein